MAIQPSYYPVWSWTWSAVIAGVFASLLVQILLTMLGLGIGIIAVDISTAGSEPTQTGWWAFVWWAMSGVLAAFVGGMVSPDDSDWARGGHALAAWAVTTVIVVAASTIAAGSAANVVSNLSGPSYSAVAEMNKLSQPRSATTGSGDRMPSQAQIEKAQKHFGYVMLASLAALLLGAGAAYAGGLSSRQEVLRMPSTI
jgi:hypothetical protein